MELPKNWELDFWFRFVDELPALNIDSYTTLDVRLAWIPVPDLEIALVGQNLLDDQHPEFESERNDTQSTEVERGVYGKITWRF
jgi:iron complex outermembrane receptor protein